MTAKWLGKILMIAVLSISVLEVALVSFFSFFFAYWLGIPTVADNE
jgi:hypothetical protein